MSRCSKITIGGEEPSVDGASRKPWHGEANTYDGEGQDEKEGGVLIEGDINEML